MGIISSFRKNMRLAKLMKRISPPNQVYDPAREFDEMMTRLVKSGTSDREQAQEELFHLVLNDPDLRAIMDTYGATEETLRGIYENLVVRGAGQWVKGAFVAAAAIATNPSLRYILDEMSREQELDENNFWLKIASEMIEYFGR